MQEVISLDIGKKIKKLRCEKFMTQAELAGDNITRNMLSCIENGTALPSLSTLRYIASKLNVSAGYLLADELEEQIYLKMDEMANIKNAYLSKNFKICRDMCMNAESCDDDEIQMILCECNLAIGIENFNNGNLRECCELLDEAIEGGGRTLYKTDHVVAAAGVRFRFMRLISATLSSNVVDESDINIYPAMTDEFCRYLLLFEATEEGVSASETKIMAVGRAESPYVLHLLARKKMNAGEYAEAYNYLHTILHGEVAIPQPMLYFVFCDLEKCCKEKEDFKGAYEFSMDKLELMQKLLS